MLRTVEVFHNESSHHISIDRYPDECGLCRYHLEPNYLDGVRIFSSPTNADRLELVFQCTRHECQSLFIGYYEITNFNSNQALLEGRNYSCDLVGCAPLNFTEEKMPKAIEELSNSFVEIYNQAHWAEHQGLDDIAGMGYRKALEFLVKDYLIDAKPDDEVEIMSKPLMKCIKSIENISIKNMAERAVWIGNDETHYYRRNADRDLNDLTTLIQLTINHLHNEILTKTYEQEMK